MRHRKRKRGSLLKSKLADPCVTAPQRQTAACTCRIGSLAATPLPPHIEVRLHLFIRVRVLEERLAKLAGAVMVLLEAIDEGTEKETAGAIRALIEEDLEE